MGINKNFVVRNGLEVDENLIFADADQNRVGISTNNPQYTLDVKGTVGVSSIKVSNELILDGSLKIGSSNGELGSYLISTEDGVAWQTLPNTRQVQTEIASENQITFEVSYIVGLIDVYLNGVRLSNNEFSANDGISVILNTPCFGGETLEFVIYYSYNVGGGGEGIGGITIKDEGNTIGSPGTVNSINFVGAAITATTTGFGVTVFISDDAAIWTKNEYDEIYLSSSEKVGIGSTLPQKTLDVGGDINFSGNLYKDGSLFISSKWSSENETDIYRLNGNVGIGTENPTRSLDVNGDLRIRGDLHLGEDGNVGTAGSILYTAGSGSGTYWGEPVGAQGITGTQGFYGTQGTQGLQGLQGIDGAFAGIGVQGLQGVQGTQGLQGLQGLQGPQGTQGVQGTQGLQGIQGLQGLQGPQGTQCVQGTQGLQGIQGLQGVQGTQGLQGVQGTQGTQGLQGVQGTQGLQGVQGTQGTQGLQGLQGLQGVQGLQGLQGTQGIFGPATIPQNSKTSSYTLQLEDNGKHISITSGGITVPQNIFASGENVVIFNDSESNQTITSGIGITMYLAGTASTGNRTLLQRGLATVLCISSNRFVVSGAGLT